MDAFRRIVRALFQGVVIWLVDAISLLLTAEITPGFNIEPVDGTSRFGVAAAAALMLGIVNLLIRPLILLLALPLGFFALFVAGFFINTIALLIASSLMPGFTVGGLLPALLGSVALSIINTIITAILDVDYGAFYNSQIERLDKSQPMAAPGDDTTGLLIIEVDGLSYHHMRKALADGYMPTLKAMLDEEGYMLDRVDCGLPSMTSAAQAGILFGDNYDIPAFRWYDKRRQRPFVSTTDAAELNARYAAGAGLLRGGSSINNMFTGDAAKSLFTLASLRGGSDEERQRRARDAYLLMVNPYFFMRTMALYLGDVILELWQAARQALRNEQPRLNRLKRGYPFVRAATTVFMRDIPLYFVSLDIVRGSPAIYYTFVGYDEVAHHSGTWSSDAFNVLRQLDRAIAHLKDLIERKAPRAYELVVLSDHGQSFGATFKMRYGLTLKALIERHLQRDARVRQVTGGDGGVASVSALAGELENIQAQAVAGKVGQTTLKRARRLIARGVEANQAEHVGAEEADAQHDVRVYGSGNLAQVYFSTHPHKLTLSELDALHPGMVDALVNHEGIGLVVGYDDAGAPVALGKSGRRNLHTGQVTGSDPLAPYADARATADFRAAQVRRVMDFPSAGDLMVISAVYPDGTVAALEELIGSHGGLGGEQTDAFIFHPATWGRIPQTSNATDIFHILNARRGLPPQPVPARRAKEITGVSDWSLETLRVGLGQARKWIGLASRCAVMDRLAYRQVASNPFMTGPALLIGLLAAFILTLTVGQGAPDWSALLIMFALRFAFWLLDTLVIFGAARALGSRASYTANLRAVGFAASVAVFDLLAAIPPLAPLVRLLTQILLFLGVWIGASEANDLRGWRSLILPLARSAVLIVSVMLTTLLLQGAAFTFDALLRDLGLMR